MRVSKLASWHQFLLGIEIIFGIGLTIGALGFLLAHGAEFAQTIDRGLGFPFAANYGILGFLIFTGVHVYIVRNSKYNETQISQSDQS